MNFCSDHEIAAHIKREPGVAAAAHGVQTPANTNKRAELAFALLYESLVAPIRAAALPDVRSRAINVKQMTGNASDLGSAKLRTIFRIASRL